MFKFLEEEVERFILQIKIDKDGAAAIVLYNNLGGDKIIEMIIKKDTKNKIMYP